MFLNLNQQLQASILWAILEGHLHGQNPQTPKIKDIRDV
jgi:hypothetical protein